MSFLLNGKVAIIIANQGLGLVISRKYVNAGASLAMCARNGDLLAKAQKE
jgi:NAD(P)-dependent dehydrogenase (short-subunit alcohol dehydrogenase family)